MVSTGNRVLVRYDVSQESPDGTNFMLNYQTDCRVRLEAFQGAIETPNFPENYPPLLDCEWDIRAGGRKNRLQLVFSHLSVEKFGDMCIDSTSADPVVAVECDWSTPFFPPTVVGFFMSLANDSLNAFPRRSVSFLLMFLEGNK